jgi:hypothetical protein
VSDENNTFNHHKDIKMKKSLLKGLSTVVIIITVLTACKTEPRKQITGVWQVVDTKFESKSNLEPELQSYWATEMKSWIYTFNADSTMTVKQADKDIPSRWKLNKKCDSIIIGTGAIFEVASKIDKLTDNELVIRTTQGIDSARVTQILYLKKEVK